MSVLVRNGAVTDFGGNAELLMESLPNRLDSCGKRLALTRDRFRIDIDIGGKRVS